MGGTSKDGYFVSSNFARDPKVRKEDTPEFDPNSLAASENARRPMWEKKMSSAKARIDVEMAEEFIPAGPWTAFRSGET